jgi:hypothetical protein
MEYGIYPNSSPEFKMVQKQDGTIQMMVRYLCKQQGYTGKWMPMAVEHEKQTSQA